MASSLPIARPAIWTRTGWPVCMGITYTLLGLLFLAVTRNEEGIATMWFPSGLLLASVLLARAERIPHFLVAGAAGSMAANLIYGNGPWTSIAFTVGNVLEPLIVLLALRDGEGARVSFTDLRRLGRFAGGAVAGAAAGAIAAGCLAGLAHGSFFLSWFTTDLLGMLVVTPVIMVAGEMIALRKRMTISRARIIEAIALLAGVAGVTTGVFLQTAYPLLFLPMMAMLFAVFRLGAMGAATSVLLIASISSIALMAGATPLDCIGVAHQGRVFFLQIYLFALLASSLPLAALLATRDRLTRQLAERNRMLNQAEQAARLGHCRINMQTRELFWSREVFRIHNRAESHPPSLEEGLLYYHRDDRQRVRTLLLGAMERSEAFEYIARIVWQDGTARHVLVRGTPDYDTRGAHIGLFGMMQDISHQVENEREIRAAQQTAERAAAEAIVMAETDQLTGLANRRRTLQLIDRTLAAARSTAQPMSVAIFDIDHFKAINDTFGHAAGDVVLQHVASAAQGAVRTGDVVGRIGGEEFVVILPGAAVFIALAVAERLRKAIETCPDLAGMQAATISVGVATLRGDEDVEALMRRADLALYEAKRNGRNRLKLAA